MAGGEPIPENPLIGSEDLAVANDTATRATQKQAATCSDASTAIEPTETMTAEPNLEDSITLVIPPEDQETIKNFWGTAAAMEDEKRADSAVDITLPEPQEEGGVPEGTTAAAVEETPVAEPTPAEASLPTPPAETTVAETPATETPAVETPAVETPAVETPVVETPAETPAEQTQPEPETQTTEPAPVPAPEEQVQVQTPPAETPAPPPPPPRNEVVFRKVCATCSNHGWRTKCYASYCLACGDSFAKMYEDEVDNEELRAKVTEAERPACNPGEEETAYCKSCLLDWFDNCIAWPHREPLPKQDGHSMLPILKPFVSDGYIQRLKQIEAYWDDKEKLFCPVPTCSAYIPRTTYTITREEEVKTVKPVEEKKEEVTAEATAEVATEATTENTTENTAEPTAENTTEPTVEATTAEPVAEPAPETPAEAVSEATPEVTPEVAPEVTETSPAEATTETPAEATTETPVEPATETTTEVATETPVEPANETTTAENTTEPAAEATAEVTEATGPVTEPTEEQKEPVPEKEPEYIIEIVKKELKSQLAICLSPTCRTPVCTLCKSHFHGLDTPCASRVSFYKEFMLAKYANPEPEPEKGEEGENKEEGNNDDDYDDEDEYEEYPNRFRQCVNCQNLVARHTGCDHMTCACGYAFCFYCGGEYGVYHSCISDDEYKEGTAVGGIKITNEEGFLDEGAEIVVNRMGMISKEEESVKVDQALDVVEYTEGEETKKSWKVKAGPEGEEKNNIEDLFTEEEMERLAKPMKAWKGKYY